MQVMYYANASAGAYNNVNTEGSQTQANVLNELQAFHKCVHEEAKLCTMCM